MCPVVFLVLLCGAALVLYFIFREIFDTPRAEDRPTVVIPEVPSKKYEPKGSPEDREVRRRRAVRTLSPLFDPPEPKPPESMYWDSLLGEYCYLAEHIFFLRELEAYHSEVRSQETERERQSLVDTPRVSVPLSAAQRLSSRPPKEKSDSYPKSYPEESWGDEDDDD